MFISTQRQYSCLWSMWLEHSKPDEKVYKRMGCLHQAVPTGTLRWLTGRHLLPASHPPTSPLSLTPSPNGRLFFPNRRSHLTGTRRWRVSSWRRSGRWRAKTLTKLQLTWGGRLSLSNQFLLSVCLCFFSSLNNPNADLTHICKEIT